MPLGLYYKRPSKKKRKRPIKEEKKEETDNAFKHNASPTNIINMNIKKANIKQPPCVQKGILPAHPFRMYVVGSSGSGKTNFLLNLLSRKCFYKNYFDSILVVSPTALNLDETYQSLKLPERNYFEPSEEVLETIMEIQEDRIEEYGKEKSPKVLLILDDIVSYKQFCSSPILLKFAVMSRHWNISMVILSQAYHRIPKSVRLQMSSIVYFKGSNRELEVLADDFAAPGYSNSAFKNKIKKATNERYSFVFIDINKPVGAGRYKKGLSEPLIEDF